MSLKKIYIAHALVGDGTPEWGDLEKNVERYLRFAAHVTNRGDVVVSWVCHYLMHIRGLTAGDHDFYLSRDKVLLKDADELWVCSPPETSNGVRFEIDCANEFGIPIRHEPEWDDSTYTP